MPLACKMTIPGRGAGLKSKQEVVSFVRHLQHLYWEERDMEELIPYHMKC